MQEMLIEFSPQELPAQSFGAMVYWSFIIGIIMILIYFFERVCRISKKWALCIILCPPLALVFIKQNWEETRAACFFFMGFYLVILFTGALSGYRMAEYTSCILQTMFLWPICFTKWLIAQGFISLDFLHH